MLLISSGTGSAPVAEPFGGLGERQRGAFGSGEVGRLPPLQPLATEVTTHRDVSAQTDANRLVQRLSELGCVVGIGALRRVAVRSWVIEMVGGHWQNQSKRLLLASGRTAFRHAARLDASV